MTLAVITGASGGIGRATAHALARRGVKVVLAARSADALERVARECRHFGVEAMAVETDVTKPQDVKSLAEAATSHFGGFDVWINNVGVGAVGRYDQVPLEAHTRVVESNLLGHMHGAHVALKHFRERGGGTLINMISIGGWLSAPYAAAYTASKFALLGFGQSLRAELGDEPDIHVCDVFPSFVDTPGLSHAANYTMRSIRPMPPLLDPDTVARRVADLLDNPRPTVTIGSVSWIGRATRNVAVETRGRVARRLLNFAFSRAREVDRTEGNLFQPSVNHDIRGGYSGSSSAFLIAAGVVGALGGAWLASRRL